MAKIRNALLALPALFAVGGVSHAADLYVGQAVAPVAEYDNSYDWDGGYVGVFGGYGMATVTEDEADDYLFDDGDSFDFEGGLLGATAGVNMSSGDFVFGVAGDVAWSGLGGVYTDITGDTIVDLDWTASLRGRVGYNAGAFLPYLTAGLALGGLTVEDDPSPSENITYVGWTVGAGVEMAVADNISVDLAYRYTDFGSQDGYDLGFADDVEVSLRSHALTAGLNFAF